MDKQTAIDLLGVVNDPHTYDSLKAYAEYRINRLRSDLEIAADMNTVSKLQGAINEIRRLFNLRDEVNQASRAN